MTNPKYTKYSKGDAQCFPWRPRRPSVNPLFLILALAVISVSSVVPSRAAIPEPGVILYGVVREDLGGATVRKTAGTLTWTIVPPAGNPVTVTTSLSNINDQFSYCVQLPVASILQGMSPPDDALMLAPVTLPYDCRNVHVGTNVASILSGTTQFEMAQSDRGQYLRFDLTVSDPPVDSDGDGLPDDWEWTYFFGAGQADVDSDGDGMSNYAEYLAGCNPNDSTSCLTCLSVDENEEQGFRLTWSSSDGRYYRVERSHSLTNGFAPIATGLAATPPMNAFVDPQVFTNAPVFYRVVLE